MVVSKNSLSLRHNNKVLTLKFTTMDELQNIQSKIYVIRGGLYVSTVKDGVSNLEVTNCDLQFRQDGITSATLCFYRTRGCYAKRDPEL